MIQNSISLLELQGAGRFKVPCCIEIVADNLQWNWTESVPRPPVSQSTLDEFVKLWRLGPNAVLSFARRWGLLGMEEHFDENPPCYQPCCEEALLKGHEPIAAWRFYSRRAHAVLSIASALRQGKLGDLTDWEVIARSWDAPPQKGPSEWATYYMQQHRMPRLDSSKDSFDDAASTIGMEVNDWLTSWKAGRERGYTDFSLEWFPDVRRWQLSFDDHGFLFAGLAQQLAQCIAGDEGIFTCSGCGFPYVRDLKRPKVGSANYCPKCRKKGIARRRAVGVYREKKTKAVRLHRTGMPLAEIARQLGAPLSRISKWVASDHPDVTL